MRTRADVLADRIEQGAQALATFGESLSTTEWQLVIPSEGRTIGVLIHHVATVYPFGVAAARSLGASTPITGVTSDSIDHGNAQHAQNHADVGQVETLALLRQNSHAAANHVRRFTDAELDGAAPVSLYSDAPLTAQFAIEDHALRHSFHHLATIRAVLNR
jgi:hypothetical protein